MKETLKQALIRIEELQHQVDSLKINGAYKIEILQSQLEQSNNTVANLGTHATSFGTMYTIIGIIVTVLTITLTVMTFVLPIWLKKRAKKSIKQIDLKFDAKILEITASYTKEIEKLNKDFNKKYEELSLVNSEQLQAVQVASMEATKEIEDDYKANLARLEANLWTVNATALMHSEKYAMAAGWFMVAACSGNDPWNNHVYAVLDNLNSFLLCLKKISAEEFDQIDFAIKSFGLATNLENYLERLDNHQISTGENIYSAIIAEIREELKSKTEQ